MTPAGATGTTGSAGPAGATGPEGPQGLAGPAGPPGATGATGAAGPAGVTGPEGPQGLAGPAGPPGATGATGAAGPAGAIGPAGPAGPAGATGPSGPPGSIGPVGPTGAPGVPGTLGPAGPPGGLANFVYRYSTNSRLTILGGDEFVFEGGSVPATPNQINVANTTATILTQPGFYEISFVGYLIGALTSVSINLNGVPVQGGTVGSLLTSSEVDISAIVQVAASNLPAAITVSNNSFATIGFPVFTTGCVVAALTIKKLS